MRLRMPLLAFALAGCATTSSAPTPAPAAADEGASQLAEIRQLRARVRHGESAKVHAELQAKLHQAPNDHHLQFLDAASGMPSEASWQAFKQQSMDAPADPWPQVAMGLIYIDWKMYPQADESFAKAEALKPGFLPVALGRAEVLLKKGDPGAQAAFQALLQRADLPEAHAGLGQLALTANDLPTARKELELAAKGDPGALDVQRALAQLAIKQNDTAAGLAAMKEVVAMEPSDGEGHLQLAKLEESAGDYASAMHEFARAGELRGIDLETAQHVAAVAHKQADAKVLQNALEQLAKIDKQNPEPLIELGDIAAAAKDTASAEADYKAALERDPKQLKAALSLARMYRDAGKRREAIESYRVLAASASAPPEAQTELQPLLADLKLSEKPLSGDVNAINNRFASDLVKFYKLRLREKPQLKGKLRISVDVDAQGKVTRVSIPEDTVNDELLALHAYFTMMDAHFPKAKRSPTFEVELTP